MKAKLVRVLDLAKRLLPFLACLLLGLLILQSANLFTWVVSVYHSCLPVFMGVLLALLLQPIIDRIQRRFSLKTSVMIVYIGIIAALVLFIWTLSPILYRQIMDFADILPQWVAKLEAFLEKYHISYGDLETVKQQYFQQGYIIVIDSAKNMMTTFTKYGIAFITAFFISIDMAFWKRTVKKVVPNLQQVSNFYQTMSNIVYQYLVGTALDLLFIIVTVGAVLMFTGFPNAILYACILALLNLFPYIGATIGLVLIAIVGGLSFDSFPFVTFAIVWTLQQIESNLIQPMIFNHTMKVRPLLTFVFIFISEAFFGVIGVILSPIFAALAQIAFRSWLHAKTTNTIGKWEDIWQDFDTVMKEEQQRY